MTLEKKLREIVELEDELGIVGGIRISANSLVTTEEAADFILGALRSCKKLLKRSESIPRFALKV